MRRRLLPLVDWVTPNAAEQAVLGDDVLDRPGLAVMVTGGDREPPDDLVRIGGVETWLPGERVETTSTHGTGCALSSALLARLVLGDEPLVAARAAKAYVAEAMRRATPLGRGRGPMHHLWTLR